MEDLIIVSAGNFAREMVLMIERINQQNKRWNLLGYVDDTPEKQNTKICGYPVLGPISSLLKREKKTYYTLPLGSGESRKKIAGILAENPKLFPATLIDPSALVAPDALIAPGCIVSFMSTISVNVKMGAFSILNIQCSLSHDVVLGDFVTLSPGVNICGNCEIEEGVFLGAGACVIDKIRVGKEALIGAGGVVVQNITHPGTYLGVPARRKS